jgi:hypothetical protein
MAKSPPMYHALVFNCQQFACMVSAAGPSGGQGATPLRCVAPLDAKMVESLFTGAPF